MRFAYLLIILAACGDNLHASSTSSDGSVDSPSADAQPLADALADICTDTVTVIQPHNPGSDPAAYPALGWWSDDTRTNGTVAVDKLLGVPAGFGCTSAHFTTGDATGSPLQDKAQLISFSQTGVPLSTIQTIGYWAYRSSASTGGPATHLALNVTVTGSSVLPAGFATLVYEPYNQSGGGAGITNDTWQHWDATATTPGDGVWWTTKIANPAPGSQANPQPWATFQVLYSNAAVLGFGFNLGSNNPNMIVAGDGLVFGTTTTDF
ncbi:hypothetical protein BH11MYX1_BH11MYX1_23040 [soil metagenome]